MTVIDKTLDYGMTYNNQTGEPMKLHRVDCSWYVRSQKSKPVLHAEAKAWMKEHPHSICVQCIHDPRSEPVTDVLDHIMSPARLLDDVLAGKKVKALCGKVITARGRSGAPICRKCFDKKFPGVK